MTIALDVIKDTLIDSLKTLPFLFLAFLLLEALEHHAGERINNALRSAGKAGPLLGSLLGCIPQCGFSVFAANLYSGGVITLGTLLAVFLATSDEALIEVKDLYKIYNPGENEVRALDGVSLTIDRGEFVAIIGHSGSGKSTFMNMLGLLDVPTSGEYKLDGHNTSKLSDDEMSEIRNKEIGFIFQGFNLISSLTAQENVELPLAYRGMPKAQRHVLSEDALKRVGLEKRMNHLPKQMSGGQQQRVAIARAVAAKPPIILADEPTGNLDSHSGAEVMRILHELHREGRTVILITHDNEIAANAHRVIRIQDGQVVEDYINADK